jgi:hypothetical protein
MTFDETPAALSAFNVSDRPMHLDEGQQDFLTNPGLGQLDNIPETRGLLGPGDRGEHAQYNRQNHDAHNASNREAELQRWCRGRRQYR